MTDIVPRILPPAAVGRLGGGCLTGWAVRPARPVLFASARPCRFLAQAGGQRAQMVWIGKPAAVGKSELSAGQIVQPVSHPFPQQPARGQHTRFEAILCPGHVRPHPVNARPIDDGRMTAVAWVGRQKLWEVSHG